MCDLWLLARQDCTRVLLAYASATQVWVQHACVQSSWWSERQAKRSAVLPNVPSPQEVAIAGNAISSLGAALQDCRLTSLDSLVVKTGHGIHFSSILSDDSQEADNP